MVLDPLTGQEQEPQNLRIVIAHKVHHQRVFSVEGVCQQAAGWT